MYCLVYLCVTFSYEIPESAVSSFSSLVYPPTLQQPSYTPCVLVHQAIGSNDDYVNAMAQHEDKLVVIKFYDQFCRACDEIRPRFEDLSTSLPEEDAIFFELEVHMRRVLPSCTCAFLRSQHVVLLCSQVLVVQAGSGLISLRKVSF